MEIQTIPPLILQPFVENAIWHGLHNLNESGSIDISVRRKGSVLFCAVEDNGVGRNLDKSHEELGLAKREPMGLKLTQERLKILNELKGVKAEFKIVDLFTTENTPAGTRVELTIPLTV